jgi:peptidoglycan/LPS O-acetylase OafA/YrhL
VSGPAAGSGGESSPAVATDPGVPSSAAELGVTGRAAPRRSGRHARSAAPRADGPTAVTDRVLPALDGVRALAIAGVIAYHLNMGWASGGYLGVDLFFVLSGFLITSLLVEEWVGSGRIVLRRFWARRARRLLPALFLVLAAIMIFVVVDDHFGPAGSAAQIDLSGLRGDALATLFYVANWHSIFAHQSYFARFTAPSPLEHTWSLAIEEQFYLFWPLVLLAVFHFFGRWWRRAGTVVVVAGIAVSAVLMALLYHPGQDPTRVYFGTDTRMFTMLAGAFVAMLAVSRAQPGPVARRVLHVAAPFALAALLAFWVVAGTSSGDYGGEPKSWMYHGGFLICAALAAVVIADVRQFHAGPLGWVLSRAPLRWIGRISYGIYLWHWPVFVYLDQARTGLSGAALDLTRLAVTLVVATASFYLVEMPVRRRTFSTARRRLILPACIVATGAVVVVGTIPAVAAPSSAAPSVAVVRTGGPAVVPGSGGYQGQQPIVLPAGRVVSPADPLRVALIGDSVMFVAAPALTAALQSTGDVQVFSNAIDGFGLTTAANWRTSIPAIIASEHPDLIVATWSWDDAAALAHPVRYRQELDEALQLMLAPGNGVAGVAFVEFPKTGPVLAPTRAEQVASDRVRAAGQKAWADIAAAMPRAFPGRVMYLPVGPSVLFDRQFTAWLPPEDDPGAPAAQWVRVRMVDDVHMCPAGAVRYADAVDADLTALFHISPPTGAWWNGSWTGDPRYNDPPGSCPDDHPASVPRAG